jgi:hypothetical protein
MSLTTLDLVKKIEKEFVLGYLRQSSALQSASLGYHGCSVQRVKVQMQLRCLFS